MNRIFYCVLPALFLILANAQALPEEEAKFLNGHNLDPTTAVLKQGDGVLGVYAISYGLTDSLTLSTSPWIDINYNMAMLDLKFGIPVNMGALKRLSIEALGFKTYPVLLNWYTQTSIMDRITGTFEFEGFEHYHLHATLNFQQFFVYAKPFSLRMVPSSDPSSCKDKVGYCGPTSTWSFGLLHQYDFSEHWGMFLETGILGFNYDNPYTHLGLSFFYITPKFLAQLGMSYTRSLAPVHATYNYSDGQGGFSAYTYDEGMYDMIHPEIQLQFPL